MNTPTFLKNFVIIASGLAFSSAAFAQLPTSKDAKFTVDDPKFGALQSPEINDGNAKNFKPKDWLEIEVKLKVDRLREQPKDNYLDEITVNWHVVVKGQDRKAYKISRSITHVNIPTDEEVYVSIYLSPNTLRRITGKPKASKSDLEAVGGEVALNGEMVGFFSHGERAGWWRKPLKDVEATSKFPLLDKTQTPFAPLWYDRYAEVKPKD
ncbi:MAG: Amuc_1102 family pilus-like protein [Akkermansiaceae bacterium]